MKKIIVLCLVVALTACAPAKPKPTATAAPLPTEAPAATEVATEAPTEAPVATEAPTVTPADEGTVSGSFTIKVSGNQLALSCSSVPSTITFDVFTEDPTVDDVYLFTRMEDKATEHLAGWSSGQAFQKLGDGNYSYTFNAESINGDQQYKVGWLDYQIVGDNKQGDPVARSDKFSQQISFTVDCP